MRSKFNVVGFCLLLACSERVIDEEGVELEISRSDVRARKVEVLEERVEQVARTCDCHYPGICYGCSGGKKCGYEFRLCSGVQACDVKTRYQSLRQIITIKGNKQVFSYPYERRETLSTTITGQCH